MMKKLLFIVLILSFGTICKSADCFSAGTCFNSAFAVSSGSETVSVAYPSANTIHHILFLAGHGFFNSGTPNVTDTAGNTWSLAVNNATSSDRVSMFYVCDAKAAASNTVTFVSGNTGSNVFAGAFIFEINANHTTGCLDSATPNTSSASGSISSFSLATAGSVSSTSELIFLSVTFGASGSDVVNTPGASDTNVQNYKASITLASKYWDVDQNATTGLSGVQTITGTEVPSATNDSIAIVGIRLDTLATSVRHQVTSY